MESDTDGFEQTSRLLTIKRKWFLYVGHISHRSKTVKKLIIVGKPVDTKIDELSEKFQKALEPPPPTALFLATLVALHFTPVSK